jgi:hypothetical protein
VEQLRHGQQLRHNFGTFGSVADASLAWDAGVSKPPVNFPPRLLNNPVGPDGKPRPAPPTLGDIASANRVAKFPLVCFCEKEGAPWRAYSKAAATPVPKRPSLP